MAIYHLSARIISRGKGQSAVAAAAYRSGERLLDETTGEIKKYKREVQPETMILAPNHAPGWVYNRQQLWNEVEKIEKNKNSQLAREFNIALPRELSNDVQRKLIQHYVQDQLVDRGMVADIAIHRDDKENPHAHVMVTVRSFNENGEWESKKKKIYQFDKNGEKVRDEKGKPIYTTESITDWNERKTLEQWREMWAEYANRYLEQAGIGEKITHLSHAKRGLEQLPTIHLGHVAHAMERRGEESDRGNINRERQQYNQEVVVELQVYREEKKALEQELARKQQEEEKAEQFSTPEERTHLLSAEKFLKKEPTFASISKRLEQIARFEDKNDKEYHSLVQKDKDFQEIKQQYYGISGSQNRITYYQEEMDSLGLVKGVTKEGKQIKQSAEHEIIRHTSIINEHEQNLVLYQRKYKFTSESEFNRIYDEYQNKRSELREQNGKRRGAISRERDVLQKAHIALENRFVREVAANYPDHPEMVYMRYETAKSIDRLNKENNTILSMEYFKQMVDSSKENLQRVTAQIGHLKNEPIRLHQVEGYFAGYQEMNALVEKYDNNLFLKGKMLVSPSANQEYSNAISEKERYQQLFEQHNVKDMEDLIRQRKQANSALHHLPDLQHQLDQWKGSFSLFEGIIQGVEQAQRQMEHEKQKEKKKPRGLRKRRRLGMDELEL
ncbi:MAG TPA: MobQ family relaxase [Bacillaceae bacterium]|nr:MobQ family relaxase [Bacillaceae bacterium]